MTNEGLEKFINAMCPSEPTKDSVLASTDYAQETEFSVMAYQEQKRTLLKILLNEEAQFTAEITDSEWSENLKNGGRVKLLFYDLFTKDKVQGNVSIREIMYDATPVEKSLSGYFRPQLGSLYDKNPPVGLHGGKIGLVHKNKERVNMRLADLSKSNDLSGDYELDFTTATELDGKKRRSYVVIMHKVWRDFSYKS